MACGHLLRGQEPVLKRFDRAAHHLAQSVEVRGPGNAMAELVHLPLPLRPGGGVKARGPAALSPPARRGVNI